MSPPARRGAILLIDDDDLIAGSLRAYLVATGSAVDVALDASAAATLMRDNRYALVVVDPYLTGAIHEDKWRLIDVIREMQPSASLVILTGYASSLAPHPQHKPAAILSKPQPIVALSNEILRTLEMKLP